MSDPHEHVVALANNGEYEKALTIAQKNNLDTDIIYKHQWEKSAVSDDAIEYCLDKIKDNTWVLDQCITRTSEEDDTNETRTHLINEFCLNIRSYQPWN
jgi:hypothetical protein